MPSHSQSEEMFLLSANEIFFLIKKEGNETNIKMFFEE
jgi:hypothetical protein